MNHCPENLCFYCAVEEYKLLEEGEEGGMKERAQEIYEVFFFCLFVFVVVVVVVVVLNICVLL